MSRCVGKKELIKEIALQTGISQENSSAVFDAIFDTIIEELSQGNSVCVRNFGTFRLFNVKPVEWHSSLTGEVYNIPAHSTPRFKASGWMKDQIRLGSTEE